MLKFKTVRGMRDFLPEEARTLRYVEDAAQKVAELYGFNEIITPTVESYELLAAKSGEEIRSRMFAFRDLGNREVALRPEFTASVARLVATTLRNEPKPLRLFNVGSVYRYDEPQNGRYREFWQSNYELIGTSKPEADAEILMLTDTLMRTVGLKNHAFRIGHIGILRGIFSQEGLSENDQSAIMQLMDKKQYENALTLAAEKGVSEKGVAVLQSLVEFKGNATSKVVERIMNIVKDYEAAVDATDNLAKILDLIRKSGYTLDVTIDAGFARGLEYYTGMIFEVYVYESNLALGGGGRYDRLVELFGSESTPAVGVAHGIDRIMLALQKQQKQCIKNIGGVAIIPTTEGLKPEALRIARMLREAGIPAEAEVMGRKMAKALEAADKRSLDFALIIGEKELKDGAVVIKDLRKREQKIVKIEKIIVTIKNAPHEN